MNANDWVAHTNRDFEVVDRIANAIFEVFKIELKSNDYEVI